jgi:hypothetical protein
LEKIPVCAVADQATRDCFNGYSIEFYLRVRDWMPFNKNGTILATMIFSPKINDWKISFMALCNGDELLSNTNTAIKPILTFTYHQ